VSTPYVGQLVCVGFNFAPYGWAMCQGQLLPISEYEALFALIGTTYGGDGQTTFALPDLRGRVPISQGPLSGGSNYVLGEVAGVEQVTITSNTYPAHTHVLAGTTSAASSQTPTNNLMANTTPGVYHNITPTVAMNAASIGMSPGSNLPHSNIQPYLALNWVISLFGVFPSQN
jgi:microcystin-dependent protein